MKSPFNSLNSILSQFTKTQEKLEAFIEKNSEAIKKERLELEIKEREQKRAQAVKTRIEEFLNVHDA